MNVFATAASFGSGLADAAKRRAGDVADAAIAARKATYGDAADACYDSVGQRCSEIKGNVLAARKATYGDAADSFYEDVLATRKATYGDAADSFYEDIGQTVTDMPANLTDAAESVATVARDLPVNTLDAAGHVGRAALAARRATYGDAADACYERAYDAVRDAADAVFRFVGGADEAPVPAEAGEPSELFVTEVEKPELAELCSAAKTVKKHTGIVLLDNDQKERNVQLILAYTRETPLYKEMNLGLRTNDAKALRKYAGYIRELRDAFAVHLPNAVVNPFSGTVRRGINVPNPAEVLKSYVVDQEYVWPSFTSTSTASGFSGNIHFEVVCPKLPADHKGYAPANIKKFSAFPSEDEILFPPHMKLRVVNVQGSKVMMETTAFPSVWEMIEHEDWEGVEKWAEMNPDRVQVDGASESLANTIAKSCSLRTVPDSIRKVVGITPELCANLGVQFVDTVGSIATFTSGSLMKMTSGTSSMLKGGYL